jgi:hypothetical protein
MTEPCAAGDCITPDILAAAMQAVRDRYDRSTSDERDNRMAFIRGDVAAALEAAEPHIRRAERERVRQLAEERMAVATYPGRSMVPFADLLAGDQPHANQMLQQSDGSLYGWGGVVNSHEHVHTHSGGSEPHAHRPDVLAGDPS